MIIVLMGVAGAGKTLIGQTLAGELGWEFFDADDFHPAANIARMQAGMPLSDVDREPWLATLQSVLRDVSAGGRNAVLACSALRARFRERLREGAGELHVVYLQASRELIAKRVASRTHHFTPAALVDSQFDALEEPTSEPNDELNSDVVIDASAAPNTIVARIRSALRV